MLSRWLVHPLTRGRDIDAPQTTELRKQIICQKPFLRKVYEEWYKLIAAQIPCGPGGVLELGTGAGFLKKYLPDLITSDVFPLQDVDLVIDAGDLPFAERVLRSIVMINVFHHCPSPRRFLVEATRCVRAGGRVVMLEPWNTAWSRLIYQRLHHETFAPHASQWEFAGDGPLSDANGALPWIIFERDRNIFAKDYPEWRILSIVELMPFLYLLSGGISLRSLMPGWSFGFWTMAEACLAPCRRMLGMFALITLEKVSI
jgi:SAM-dependent methyltransferase